MKKLRNDQSGFSAVEAALIVVALIIVGFTGYFVYQAQNNTNKTLHQTNKTAQSGQTANGSGASPRYVSFGNPGVSVRASGDVAMLTSAGDALKTYFKDNVGKPVNTLDGVIPRTFTVSALYGDYAYGSSNDYAGAPVVWGPKANGSVDVLISSQEVLGCKELSALHIPARLFTGGQCQSPGGNPVTYKG